MTPPRAPMRKGLRILLIASLALNVAVAGLAIGAALKWQRGGPPRSIEMAAGPLGQALSHEDRREMGEAMRRNPDLRLPSRREMNRLMEDVVQILRAEPFDRAALEAVMADLRGRVAEARAAATGLIVDRIAEMSPEERAAYADALERAQGEGRRRN